MNEEDADYIAKLCGNMVRAMAELLQAIAFRCPAGDKHNFKKHKGKKHPYCKHCGYNEYGRRVKVPKAERKP